MNESRQTVGNGMIGRRPCGFVMNAHAVKTLIPLVMKRWVVSMLAIPGLASLCHGQPAMTNGVKHTISFDEEGLRRIEYVVFADKYNELPESWNSGYTLVLNRVRILRASPQKINCSHGELIDSSKDVYKIVVGSELPVEVYDLPLLDYRAVLISEWRYTTVVPRFELESDIVLGFRVMRESGDHYGWIRLTRTVVDEHSPFEIDGHAVHPVPGEPIAAGLPPPLPRMRAEVSSGEIGISWDTRWGSLVLESTRSLQPPVIWKDVRTSAGGPVRLPLPEESHGFYRLRQP